jgi:hypothetical protein
MRVIIKYNFLNLKPDSEEYEDLSIDNTFNRLIELFLSTKAPVTAETDEFFIWIDNPSLQIYASKIVKDCNDHQDDC